jgi:hypothetical protein
MERRVRHTTGSRALPFICWVATGGTLAAGSGAGICDLGVFTETAHSGVRDVET